MVDPKGGMEFRAGRPLFARYEDSSHEAMIGLLEDAADAMDARTNRLAGHVRSHTPTVGDPFVVVLVDEVADLTAHAPDIGDEEARRLRPVPPARQGPGARVRGRRGGDRPAQGRDPVPGPVPHPDRHAPRGAGADRPRPRRRRPRPRSRLLHHPPRPARASATCTTTPPPTPPRSGSGSATSPTTTSPPWSPTTSPPSTTRSRPTVAELDRSAA